MTETPDLLSLLPPLNRARGFRVYAQGGRRLVDLWQYGGRAVLGHNPPHVLRELKNAADRGLLAPLPHLRESRLVKALSRLFPGSGIRLFASEVSLRRALREAGVPGAEVPFPDPALAGPSEGLPLSLWRPFLPEPAAPLLIPVLPWPLAPTVLIIRDGEKAMSQGDRISPILIAATARVVYDLIAAPERGTVRFPRIWKALSRSHWQRQGIYLSFTGAADTYGELFRCFLDGGFLLPPDPGSPLILPGVLSPGEEAKLAELLQVDGFGRS